MEHAQNRTGSATMHTAGTEGRSRYTLVAVAAGLALAVSLLCAMWGPWPSLVATLALVLTIAWGWPSASGAAEVRGDKLILSHTLITAICGAGSCVLMFAVPSGSLPTLLPAVAAVGILASFIAELMRGEGAFARLESVISSCVGVLVAVSASGWIGMSLVHESEKAGGIVWGTGAVIAVLIAAVGTRMIAAGPEGGPRRGAVTLGLTPVAFFGIVGYASTFFLARVLV